MLAWPSAPAGVLRHMCVLLAAVCGATGGEGASDLATQALALTSRLPTPDLGLELLGSLAEEADDLDRGRRLALVTVLLPRSRDVLTAMASLLAEGGEPACLPMPSTLGAPAVCGRAERPPTADRPLPFLPSAGPGTSKAKALRCCSAWLRLNPLAGGGCVLAPSELLCNHASLFAFLMACVSEAGSSCQGDVLAAGVEVLLLLFGPGNHARDEEADLVAMIALMAALCQLGGRVGGGGGAATAAAQLGSALAERCPEVCCSPGTREVRRSSALPGLPSAAGWLAAALLLGRAGRRRRCCCCRARSGAS